MERFIRMTDGKSRLIFIRLSDRYSNEGTAVEGVTFRKDLYAYIRALIAFFRALREKAT